MLIGMNVEQGDGVINSLGSQAEFVNGELSSLQARVNELLGTWMGHSRSVFEESWTPWLAQVQNILAQMEEMQRRLAATVEAFRNADKF